MKFLRNLGITIIVLVVAFLMLRQLNWIPNIGSWFKSKPLLIQNTPLVIESIKELNQLTTISSYDEVVMVRQNVSNETFLGNLIKNKTIDNGLKRIAIITKGTVYAGMDLRELQTKDIYLKGDSIALKLPPTKILDAIINPSDTEIFEEQGNWDLLEVNRIKGEAKEKIIERAKDRKILEKAQIRGKAIIENFLKSIGFKKISVTTTSAF